MTIKINGTIILESNSALKQLWMSNNIKIHNNIFCLFSFTNNAENILNDGIERTNVVYGALSSAVDRVIYTHGTIDPWHAIGLLEEINTESPVIVVKGKYNYSTYINPIISSTY